MVKLANAKLSMRATRCTNEPGMMMLSYPFNRNINELLKQIPGCRYAPEYGKGTWIAPEEVSHELTAIADSARLHFKKDYLTPNLQMIDYDEQGINPQLYPFQKEGVGKALQLRRLLINFEMGLGKTPTAIEVLRLADVEKVIIVCPAVARNVWAAEFKKWWESCQLSIEIITTGKEAESATAKVVITSYELLHKLNDNYSSIDAIILDECFPAGTLVNTPNGKVPIEKLQSGDEVYGIDKAGPTIETVQHVFKRTTKQLLDIKLSGQYIKTTPNHPFLTTNGWKKAGELNVGDEVVQLVQEESMQNESNKVLLNKLLSKVENAPTGNTEKNLYSAIKQKTLLSNEGSTQEESTVSKGVFTKNVYVQPNCEGFYQSEDIGVFESDWTQASNTRRKRETDSEASEEASQSTRLAARVSNHPWYSEERLPNPLQSRHRQSSNNDSSRSRRCITLSPEETGTRQEEGKSAFTVRLARVESIERRSVTPNEEDSTVYNLEVSGPHTYMIQDGLVVHNCHYIKNGSAQRSKNIAQLVSQQNKNCIILGLTGTPITSEPIDVWHQLHCLYPGRFGTYWKFAYAYCNVEKNEYGQRVYGINRDRSPELEKRLDAVCCRITKDEVAHLLPPLTVQAITVKPSSDFNIDAMLRAFSQGDTSAIELMQSSSSDQKMNTIIQWVVNDIEDSSHIVVFTHLRATARQIAAELNEVKIPNVCITGEMPAKDRQAVIDAARDLPRCVVVATMHSIGIAIDMTFCTTGIMAELDYSPANNVQALGRLHRLSGNQPVFMKILVLEGTLDEQVARSVKRKVRDSGEILRSGKVETKMIEALDEKSDVQFLTDLRTVAAQMVEDDYT